MIIYNRIKNSIMLSLTRFSKFKWISNPLLTRRKRKEEEKNNTFFYAYFSAFASRTGGAESGAWKILCDSIPELNNREKVETYYPLIEEAFNKHCQSLIGDLDVEKVVKFMDDVALQYPGLRLRLYRYLPKPHAFIKNLAVEIDPDYTFANSPVADNPKRKDDKKEFFIGRKTDLKKFGKLLNSEVKKGVFLVTGYRGMGKTSFVNHAINTYREGRKRRLFCKSIKVQVINLNLAQRNPSETDILKLMVSHLHNAYFSEKRNFSLWLSIILKTALSLFLAALLLLFALNYTSQLRRVLRAENAIFTADSLEMYDQAGRKIILFKERALDSDTIISAKLQDTRYKK